MKISGANRVSATDLPPYDDVKPIAEALIEAVPDPIMWGPTRHIHINPGQPQ
jgi:predicted TIM-barrel fold metal-dependent hydrolase